MAEPPSKAAPGPPEAVAPAKETVSSDPTPAAAPDPDSDDLDDLDDVLDEFSTQSATTKPPASGPGRPEPPREHAPNLSVLDDKDFQNELEKEMASLMTELENKPELEGSMMDKLGEYIAQAKGASEKEIGGSSKAEGEDVLTQLQKDMASMMSSTDEKPGEIDAEIAKSLAEIDANPELQKDIQEFLSKLDKAADAVEQEEDQSNKGKGKPAVPPENAFQETIRKTMARMQESGDQASAAAEASNEEDLLAQLLKEMGNMNGAGAGDDDFSKMLLGMMEQLTNKEILYEPMKELHDKFPAWMEKNKDNTPKPDMDRYVEQRKLVTEIVARFERKEYSDDNAQDREFIVERMQKMQAAGSPPADLVGDMKDAQALLGDLGEDGTASDPDMGCPQQ